MFSLRTRIIALSFHWCCPSIVRRGRRRPVVAPLESYYDASVAAARADLASARSGQDVMAAAIVPAHQIGLDGSLTEYSGHRILSVSSRDVAMDINVRYGLDESFFLGVCHGRSNMIANRESRKGFCESSARAQRAHPTSAYGLAGA